MKIRLSEIPKEGRSYTFNRETAELDTALEDLVQQHDYQVDLFIKPIGNAFEMRGKVNATLTELCARCGWEIDIAVEKPVNEILMEIDQDEHRKTQSVHGNQAMDFSSDGPALVAYTGEGFDAGDFVRDVIGIAEPAYASCGDEDCEHLKEALAIQAKLAEEFERAEIKSEGHPAFAALKSLTQDH